MRKYLAILLLLLVPQFALATPALDQSATASSADANATSLTINITPGGTNRLLCTTVGLASTRTITGIDLGGVAFSQQTTVANADSGVKTEIWCLANPATGAGTITINTSGATAIWAVAASFTGVNINSPIGATSTASGESTSASVTATTTYSNSLVIDGAYLGDVHTNWTVNGTQTKIAGANRFTGSISDGMSYRAVSSPSSTGMTWTHAATKFWATALVEIKDSSTAVLSRQIRGTGISR